MGVVSGIVMSFQFGTNWAGFSVVAGNVIGPLLNYEVLTAFFLEASFLGVMLFGWRKVSDRTHFFATCMVAIGTLISTFWIMAANSWMQTPAGYALTRRHVLSGGLDGDDLQPVVPVPAAAHGAGRVHLHRDCDRRRVAPGTCCKGRFADKSRVMLKLALAFAAPS